MTHKLLPYLEFATETLRLAGKITLDYFQTNLQIEYKMDNSPVTSADREAETFIRARIAKRFPHHSIVGEELGPKESGETSHRWYIDPIDGTKSFMRGVPLYAVLLALEIDGNVEVGAAYFPALDEMISAATSQGCWWNGKRSYVSTISDLDQSYVVHAPPASMKKYGREEAWNRIQSATYFQATWGDAYGYLLVATGRVEAMLDPIMNVWDCAPFLPILNEAGGYFGDWSGKATIHKSESMATNGSLLPDLLLLINS